MFTELALSSSVDDSIPNSSSSSTSVSPISSTTHSRTSTITSLNGCIRTAPLSSRQMKIGNYFLERTIGKGNFAVVKLATHCDTHQKVFNDN
jgi:hypothetical protein